MENLASSSQSVTPLVNTLTLIAVAIITAIAPMGCMLLAWKKWRHSLKLKAQTQTGAAANTQNANAPRITLRMMMRHPRFWWLLLQFTGVVCGWLLLWDMLHDSSPFTARHAALLMLIAWLCLPFWKAHGDL